MDAGAARGIAIGDEFTPYSTRESPSPLGSFVVREAHPFRSIMDPVPSDSKFDLPAYVLQTKAGKERDLPVYVADDKELVSVLDKVDQKMHSGKPGRPGIRRVEKDKALLMIHLDQKKVVFGILDEHVATFCKSQRIPFSVDLNVNKLLPILGSAAHFYWHLIRTAKFRNLEKKVRLVFTKVKVVEGKYDDDLMPVIEPVGGNLNQNGVVNLVSGKETYGIKIINDTELPLYAALFYFDTSDLSISMSSISVVFQSEALTHFLSLELLSHLPPVSDYKVDPSLPDKGSITLGYGSGGGAPLDFTLAKGRDVEVGFLKLFLSTDHVDLSDIEQTSPFASARPIGRAELPTMPKLWDSILVSVVIRKT
jgi:hypothetical protein